MVILSAPCFHSYSEPTALSSSPCLRNISAMSVSAARGLLSDREIDDACEIWVDALDGKPKSEFETENGAPVRDEWFIEVEV